MGIGFSERGALDDMYKKGSSELVVARRRRGSDNGRQHMRVAAADRVQGPLGEDDGDDAVERDDRRVGEDSPITLQATRLRSSRLFRIEPRFTAVVMKPSQGGRNRQRRRNHCIKTARQCTHSRHQVGERRIPHSSGIS